MSAADREPVVAGDDPRTGGRSRRQRARFPGSRLAVPRARRAALVAAVLAIAGGGWWLASGIWGEEQTPWIDVVVGDLTVVVPIEGTLASRDSSLLTPPAVERLYDFKISFMAPEGEEVDRDTPVLGFDTTELERRLRDRQTEAEQAGKQLEKLEADRQQDEMQRELELAEAEAELRKAELKVDVPADLASARELEIARLDLEAAQMKVSSLEEQLAAATLEWDAQKSVLESRQARAEREVREIEDAIERMTVRAPRSGTVIYVSDYRGEKHKVGDSVWRHERVVELPNLRQMMGQAEVDEADASRIEIGQPFRIRLDAHPDVQFAGSVESIWKTVQQKSGSRAPLKVVRLDLAFDEPDLQRMRPGMRFRGEVETERATEVVMVPVRAVFPTPEGPIVYRRTMLGFEATPVELGLHSDAWIEVRSGLSAGDLVAEALPTQ